MFVCLNCGNAFSEDEIEYWTERHGLEYGGEEWSGSPCCQCGYVEAHRCDCCDEYITTDEYVEIGDAQYCWDCITIKKLTDI